MPRMPPAALSIPNAHSHTAIESPVRGTSLPGALGDAGSAKAGISAVSL